jgi:ubiquinone/menaquinone biosynthesis C-methylase UbiE
MSEGNARFLGTIPELYDRHLGPVIFEPYAADLARRVTASADATVLEVACGTGILTRHLRERLPGSVKLTATDLNQPMIDYARSKSGFDALEPIEWRSADAAALPFPAAAFDALVCQFGLMFVPDKDAAFREARRVLKHGGLLAFNVWDSLAHNAFGRLAHETIGGFFATDAPNFYQVPFGFHDPDVLRRLLTANDFGKVELDHVTLDVRSASAKSLATGLVRGNPVAIAIQERGIPLEPIVDALEAAFVKLGGSEPFESTTRAVVVTARAGAK